MQNMRLVVLTDNRKVDESLESEHGLSIYLETDQYKCLLDTGASDIFIHNAEKLGIDLLDVDYVFISHGHADHIGGLPAFLEMNSKAKVILSSHALNQRFFSKRLGMHEIGIELDVNQYPGRFVFVDSEWVSENDIRVFSSLSNTFPLPKGNRALFKDVGKGLEPDDFNHELIVCFGTDKLLVFTGCGHKGLFNILDTVKEKTNKRVRCVIGGFHMLDSTALQQYESKEEIEAIAEILKRDYPQTDFITGHCTGEGVYSQLKSVLGDKSDHFYTGYEKIIN